LLPGDRGALLDVREDILANVELSIQLGDPLQRRSEERHHPAPSHSVEVRINVMAIETYHPEII